MEYRSAKPNITCPKKEKPVFTPPPQNVSTSINVIIKQ